MEMETNNPIKNKPNIQPGITNLGDVKDYLVSEISGLIYSEVSNSQKALDIAKKHNIQFPDWGKWIEVQS